MKEFIETIVKALVDNPDAVALTEVQGVRTTVYELRVGPDDLGKVIGKHGQTAKSIRILISAISAKKGKRAVLEILE
ncbi:MAG: KH domain-containing protein [candidate division Zixibacteria bacterium]|nr:KH domain-containing protein [candidate division Zixibacteria bacterium]